MIILPPVIHTNQLLEVIQFSTIRNTPGNMYRSEKCDRI